jgi:Carboxypeptidase regulatory-like domain/TonB-dependent Receptor Plug Domain/TonB dependent receptor
MNNPGKARWRNLACGALLWLLGCVGLVLVAPANAQSLYGTIVGVVTDASGAAVPGATVKATQVETNEQRSTITNESGFYTLTTIPSGSYVLSISKPGFEVYQANGIRLTIDTKVRVDATLRLHGQQQTIKVFANTPELQTDQADVHGLLSSQQLQQLPQPTRTYEGLIGLLPGITPPNPGFAGAGGTNNPARSMLINANGTSASGTNVSIDGVSATNAWVQYYSTAVPSIEAIETVDVVTASSPADQGIMSGGGIRLEIKSGTNFLHGSAYWYNENNALKAKPYFQPAATRKPKYIDNDAGVTVGGPIRRDKLFFFGSYEGDFLREAMGNFYTLPTPDMASGVLASPTPVFDPATGNPDGSGRTPFPQDAAGNYLIAPSRISSVSQKLIAQLPSGVPNGVYANNLYINSPYSYDLQKIDTKIDWNTTPQWRLSARFSDYPYSQTQPPALGNVLGPGLGYNTDQFGNIYSVSALATYVANPHFVVDAVFGLTHTDQNLLAPLSNMRYGAQVLGIPNTNLGPLPTAGGVPQFNFTTGSLDGFGYGYPSLVYDDPVFQYTGNATWIRGNHSIRFGLDISQQHMNHKEVTPTQFNFNGGLTSLYCPSAGAPGCGAGSPATNQFNSWADFLLGLPQNAVNNVLNVPNYITLRSWMFAPYVSDSYQLSPNLTLYAGTGWDYFPIPQRQNRGVEYFNPATGVYEICGEGSIPTGCGISIQHWLFAPRAGAAYRIRPQLVLRAGYALTPEQINMYRDGLYNYPLTLSQSLPSQNTYTAATTLAAGFPVLQSPDISTGIVPLPPVVGISSSPQHFVRGYTETYNVSAQREFGWNVLAQIAYVGSLTIHQHTRYNANYGLPGGGIASQQLDPAFGITATETIIDPFEHMHYNSLQLQVEKRMNHGLQFFASYTWSRWRGLCCDENGDNQPEIPIPQYRARNVARMPDDRPNNFQLSAIYQLPFGKNQPYLSQGIAAAVAGGWQVNGVLAYYSGTPFWISAPATSLNAPGSPQLADLVKPHVQVYGAHGLVSPYFDTSAFAPVTAARFGTSSFDILRGPAYGALDLGLFRTFGIRGGFKAQIHLESFNLTNRPNFSNPDSGVTDPDFGLITSTNPGSRLIAERYFRVGLKFLY